MLVGKVTDVCVEKWFRQLEISCDKPTMSNATREERGRMLKKRKSMWEALYEQNKDGDNFLHFAVMDESVDSIDFLLKMAPHPCILDLQNENEQTALHLSVLTNQTVIIKKLISAGANTLIRDQNGNTALHLACIYNELDCVSELLSNFDLNLHFLEKVKMENFKQWNYDGLQCIHIAAERNHLSILRYLVKYGADVNVKEGNSGRTALHIAVEQNYESMVSFLLHECPSIQLEVKTYAGLTAYQLALLTNNQKVSNILLICGAKRRSIPPMDDEDLV